ncbi:hypothetical protein O181_066901 [Austropuccinia psidii MF-1]|uniref:Uncharacterized protein n=1 Tax=Austropuccinia psidii MF-1 TaxID=1389203 RepID=A0A9Q3I2K8_9BASI|nr:hypothetical protein [Austropuccinia psidii MF-1]
MDWVTALNPGGDRSYTAHLVIVGRLSQTCVITPPMGVCGKYSLTSFYGQLVMSSVLWPLGNTTFYWPLMASGHILQTFAFLTNSPPHQPPGQLGPLKPLWPTVRGTLVLLLA